MYTHYEMSYQAPYKSAHTIYYTVGPTASKLSKGWHRQRKGGRGGWAERSDAHANTRGVNPAVRLN